MIHNMCKLLTYSNNLCYNPSYNMCILLTYSNNLYYNTSYTTTNNLY